MSRDDSLLYSGSNSSSFASPKLRALEDKRQQDKDNRKEIGQKLRPSAEIVNAIIDREKELVIKELANLPINVATTKENVKELLMAYQRNLVFIEHVRTSINIALKDAS